LKKGKEELITKYVKVPENLLKEIEEEFKGFQFSEIVRGALKLYLHFFEGKLNFEAFKKEDDK